MLRSCLEITSLFSLPDSVRTELVEVRWRPFDKLRVKGNRELIKRQFLRVEEVQNLPDHQVALRHPLTLRWKMVSYPMPLPQVQNIIIRDCICCYVSLVKENFQMVNTLTNSLPSPLEEANGIKFSEYTEYLCHGESEASTLVSSFYRNLGLTIRVVDVKKILAERTESNTKTTQFRPFSCLFPGSKRVVVKPVADLNEWADIVINGLVTVHKPIADGVMKWAYKRDASTDAKGETTDAGLKKITDFATLKDKTMECRDESLFPPCSSGHVGRDGYLLHQSLLQKVENANDYPEIICPYNFDQTHCGYLLDFRREQCFFNIAKFMENILLLESDDGAGQMLKPVVIFLYDSFRGVLLPPVELNGTLLKKIADNARVFTRYTGSLDEERKLCNLLAHAGYKRFLQLLMNNIPESVNAVANTPQPINMESIKQAIVNLEADKAVTMLSEIDDELIGSIGLPTTLMDQLTYNPVFTYQDCKGYKYPDIDDFFRHHIGKNRSRELMRTTFAAQGKICRALLKKNVFVPVILQGEDSLYNPLVCCLLIANGSRINFAGWGFEVSRSLFPIIAAMEFYRENLLSEAELKIIRYETLWQIVSNSTSLSVTDPDKNPEAISQVGEYSGKSSAAAVPCRLGSTTVSANLQ